ncbi:MAG: hypothetical protein JSW13_05850 [Candidatus Aerophobus sp.]|nr:MAG: hypothetical protein JSW13_05850 [Candidatus Aerophobus sp.]
MHRRGRIFWLFVLILFSLPIGISPAGEKDTPRSKDFSGIDFGDGLLRVSVENQKFQKVMDEVAKKTGIRIVFNGITDEDLTIHFDYLPLEKGLKKLLRGRNYVFVYFSDEPSQAAKMKKVLVFPKSEERIATGMKGSTESRSAHRAGQKETRENKENADGERLDEILQTFSQSGMDINEEMIQEIKDLGEMGREFSEAFETIQKMEGFKQMMGFEDMAEKNLAAQPEQKGSLRETKNVDGERFDEVLKAFTQGEGERNQ